MDLNEKERLQFYYQLKILEKLYPEENYTDLRIAVENGYELHYSWLTQELNDGLTKEQCTEVIEILSMYRSIFYSYDRLDNKNDIDNDKIYFPGFDGNNETAQMSYAEYFINKLGRFKEIEEYSNNSYNSHARYIPTYKKMLNIFINSKKDSGNIMSKNQLIKLLEIAPTRF